MFSKNTLFSLTLGLFLSAALAACNSLPPAGLSLFSGTQPQPGSDLAKMTVANKLGIGILKLEGTSQAVTASQADALLPLWKAVYMMGNDKNASKIEVNALYDQIQETLTPDQVSAIQQLVLTPQEIASLKEKYGSVSSGLTTSITSSSTTGSSQNAGGPPDMGGPGGPMGDITTVGLNSSSSTAATKSSSSSSAKAGQTSSSMDMNPTFASAIIDILKKRVGLE